MYAQNGFLYITGKDLKPIMIQSFSHAGIEDNEQGEEESNDFFDKLINIKILDSAILSNGVTYGKTRVAKDGMESENYFLEIGHEGYTRVVQFIVWDETINLKLIRKISISFISVPID